ncbi:MAG: type II toxin-antitoxin system RelE/ParE family toxin [Azonexus sp.]|nr:type II toxin-antitoxin system RelE/ParE family toxin [Azonexus sp.]
MLDIVQSETFSRWLSKLKDRSTIMRVNARLRRIAETGNFGDAKPVRDGVSEIRIDYGPGYRLYYIQSGPVLVILLAGGDKRTQDADIKRAIDISKEWKP